MISPDALLIRTTSGLPFLVKGNCAFRQLQEIRNLRLLRDRRFASTPALSEENQAGGASK